MENNVETVLTGNAENTVINAEMQNIDENAGVEIFEPPVSTEDEQTPEANTPKTENTAKVTPKVEKKTEVKAATDATATDATTADTADTTGLVDAQTEETTETVLVVDETPASALANSNEALVMTAYVAIIVVAVATLGMMIMNFVKNFRDGLPKSKKAKKSKKKAKKSKKTAKSKKKAKTTKTKKK